MKDYNKFIEEAKPLFERYLIIESKDGTSLPIKTSSFIAIVGDYFLNREFNGKYFQHTFKLVIILDRTGEFVIPIVWLPDEKRPYGFEHMYKNNTCCLGLTHEIVSIWGENQTAYEFFDRILDIFLVNFLSYRLYRHCVTDERPHGTVGIVDYYKDIFCMDEGECYKTLLYLYNKVIRNEYAKGHNKCPCGSGKNIRNCHVAQFNNFLDCLYSNTELKKAFIQDLQGINI